MESIWRQTIPSISKERLTEDRNADVVIIGAGITGITTAYFLQNQGFHVIVLEAGCIGGGQTQNTTAKLTAQHGAIYHQLIEDFGRDAAKQYADANERALQDYRKLLQHLPCDCHYMEAPAYLYTTADPQLLRQEADAASELGLHAVFTTETELPFSVQGAVRFDDQAHFNPLEFLYTLASQLEVYTQTPVISVDDNTVCTASGNVKANHIIFACHFPFINSPGYYFMRMHQERSYVVSYRNIPPMKGMYLGIDQDGLSFRPYEDQLLIGGSSHRTGDNTSGGRYTRLRHQALTYWPQAEETGYWSAQDCITLDGIPYIGRFSASLDHWYVATGFGKWGMTSSMVAARLLTDLIIGKKNPYEALYSPQRFRISESAINLMEESLQSIKGLARQFLIPPREEIDSLEPDHGGIVSYEGEKVGVYKDLEGEIYIVSVRCPHLGCQLEWNPDEKSWDCPCHGSRFNYKGSWLNGPAQTSLDSQ